MTLVVSMSANTAAYAAQAVKPSARVSGDQLTEEAITLLAGAKRHEPFATAQIVSKVGNQSAMSLMLMNAHGRQPQNTRHEAIRLYRENSGDEELEDDRPEPSPDRGDDDA